MKESNPICHIKVRNSLTITLKQIFKAYMVLLQESRTTRVFIKRKRGNHTRIQDRGVQRQQVNGKFSATGKRKGTTNYFSLSQHRQNSVPYQVGTLPSYLDRGSCQLSGFVKQKAGEGKRVKQADPSKPAQRIEIRQKELKDDRRSHDQLKVSNPTQRNGSIDR